MNKSAIILGATGLTGNFVLEELLKNEEYSKLLVFSRIELGIKHDKLEVIICDLLKIEEQQEKFQANEVYVCIGSTTNKTPNKKLYRDIDFGIPVAAAKLCKANNIKCISIISSLGANARSTVFYPKTKGEMENEVMAFGIEKTYLLRPSMILGARQENRLGESLGKILLSIISPFMLGKLTRYKGIEAKTIANAMIWLSNNDHSNGTIESEIIRKLV
ncbi:MAG: NAD(P)H-binding protein [Flavobacteriales bacterium]|nr:NAD(P)H-binding protein [Flavobacteriales bacterium]